MKSFLLVTAFGLGLLAISPDASAEYKCACEKNSKAGIEGSKDANMTCNETYSGYSNSVSVQESHLKIYVSSDNVQQGDKDMNIRFRPRDQKCLERVADGVRESIIWEGAYCNNDSYKDLGQFKLEENKDKPGAWTAKFQGKTGGKDYNGFAMFVENGDKKYMNALCMDNK